MNLNTQNITTEIEQAAQWLQQGKLLAYPTESVWGIGCDAYNEEAVNQILTIKNRPAEKGMIVVTDSIERIRPLINQLPVQRQQQIIESWAPQSNKGDASRNTQQAHTWLLPLPLSKPEIQSKSKSELTALAQQDPVIPYWITGKHNSIAVRVINHPLIAQRLRQAAKKYTKAFNEYYDGTFYDYLKSEKIKYIEFSCDLEISI